MTRLLWLVTLTLAATASAAPVPKAKGTGEVFPSAVGTKWEYIRNGDENTVYAEEVTEATERGGVKSFTVTFTDNTGTQQANEYELREEGLYLAGSSRHTVPTPFPVRKKEMKASDNWLGHFEVNGVTLRYEFSVGSPEEVTTPAGKFTATPITRKLTPNQGESVNWYADGVGMVKQTTNGKVVKELKSFTPAKEAKK